jgi:hypothetical protein
MKPTVLILFLLLFHTGCGVTKIVTVPLGIAGTAVKITGKTTKTTLDATQLVIPDEIEKSTKTSNQ